MDDIESKAARYVLGKSRTDRSRSAGDEELNWLSVPQTAVEFSLRLFFRTLKTGKPGRIFKSLQREGTIMKYTDQELKKMTKLARKTWKVRVLRYAEILPEYLFSIDPKSHLFKSSLKSWVRIHIPKNGDFIFRGKEEEKEEDWLTLELMNWKRTHEEKYTTVEAIEKWEKEGQG